MTFGISAADEQTCTTLIDGAIIAEMAESSALRLFMLVMKMTPPRQTPKQAVNRKRRKSSQSSEILERVSALLEAETAEVAAVQEDTWNEQTQLIQDQRTAQKLTTLYAMLDRNNAVTQQLLTKRHEYIAQGRDASEIGDAIANQQQKKETLELHINQLECDVMHGIQQ
ncbi:hypothetical protein DVH05_015568 [Phytophthora capsici]|nr:hypothetical protein DVH05_015568 [Phytophthora capsici]